MGAVYKARQPKLDRLIALKILNRDERDSGFVERFAREAKTLAKLSHPNIVAVHEFGERDGLFFLIMEMVDGRRCDRFCGRENEAGGGAGDRSADLRGVAVRA